MFVLPPLLGALIVFYFMRRMYVRSQQVYMVRPSSEKKPVSKLIGMAFFTLMPVIFAVISYFVVVKYLAGIENQTMANFLGWSTVLVVAPTAFFTNLGMIFVCTDAVEELIKEARSTSKYIVLASLSILSMAAALLLIFFSLRNANTMLSAQSETVFKACEVYAFFSIGAFMAGFLPARVRESMATRPGFTKRMVWALAGHIVVIVGMGVAAYILKGNGIL
jgi:hypothetical protein